MPHWLARGTENARFAKFSKFSKSKTLIFNKVRFTKSARFSKLDVLSQPVAPARQVGFRRQLFQKLTKRSTSHLQK